MTAIFPEPTLSGRLHQERAWQPAGSTSPEARQPMMKQAESTDVVVFPSASRNEATVSPDQVTPPGCRGVRLTLDVAEISGQNAFLDVHIEARDGVSGKYVDVDGATFGRKKAVGTYPMVIYPDIGMSEHRKVSDVIPRVWRAVAAVTGGGASAAFSLGASYLP